MTHSEPDSGSEALGSGRHSQCVNTTIVESYANGMFMQRGHQRLSHRNSPAAAVRGGGILQSEFGLRVVALNADFVFPAGM